jgi:signal transduction histidine kinase/ActR/RegA family two-component response regulator
MNWLFLIPLAALVANLFVSALVFGRRRRGPVNVAFLLFLVAWAFWLALELLLCTSAFAGQRVLLLKLMIPFWTSLGILYLNFAYEFLGRRRDPVFYGVLALTVVAMVANLFSSRVTYGYELRWWGVADLRDPFLHTLACLPSMIGGGYGVALMARRYLVTYDPSERRAFLVFLIGSATTLACVIVANVVLPNAFGMISFARYGSATAMFFLAGVYVAATRFQFLGFTVDDVAAELFEDHPDGVVLLGNEGAVIHMNGAARRMFLRGGDEPAGAVASAFLPADALAARDRGGLFSLPTADGTRVVSASAPHFLPHSRRGGHIILFRDETEEQEARAVLRRSRDELEREVRRRTDEVMRVQRMEALGALAGGIGHDFNNLLTATMGFATAARDELEVESPLRKDLEEILLASRRGREIVRQMLTFSDGTPGSAEPTDVAALVEEAINLLSATRPPVVVIERAWSGGSYVVTCDPTRLHQVFMNIGVNALLAMKGTGGALRIGIEIVDVDAAFASLHTPLEVRRHVRVTFDDRGVGMDAETLGRAFEPFFTTRRSGEGSGLGLATALQIVRELRGTILVESELGRGTTFAVYLPARAEGVARGAEDAPVRGGEERVMFVDDREQVVRMARRLLSSLGYTVTSFTDPNAALAALESRPTAYDIIVTDLAMPEMSGIALGARARRIAPKIRLALVTGNLTRAQRDEAFAAGFDGALQKPLAKEELAAELRRVLDRPREVR